jgi:tetratricopeptide (TPR) repeat protein
MEQQQGGDDERHIIKDINDDDDGGGIIQDAEVVTSKHDKHQTRLLIKEATRAAMLAHYTPSITGGLDENDSIMKTDCTPYGRRVNKLDNALQRLRLNVDEQNALEYARNCIIVGELQYELGRLDDSQDTYMSALKRIMTGDDFGHEDDNNITDSNGNIESRILTGQCMQALGSIHAKCGEYDEASRWYNEALKEKMRILDEVLFDESAPSEDHRYELGKTYNGLATLEAMRGGNGEKAMFLFQEAERNYLYGFHQTKSESNEVEHGNLWIAKEDIHQMTPRRVESLITVRSNMCELLRQQGDDVASVEMIKSAIDIAKIALENVHERKLVGSTQNRTFGLDHDSEYNVNKGDDLDEQRNAIVDLYLQLAGVYMSANKYDDAAEAYEQSLSYHVYFRKFSNNDEQNRNRKTVLPAFTAKSTNPPDLDLTIATKIEATIRRNLADALAHIGQDNLSLQHYESSLAIKRHIGGDLHLDVASTLMDIGALTGGPLRDFSKALICFKEALYIYRTNLKEQSSAETDRKEKYMLSDDQDVAEINRSIEYALKNISLVETAILKDRDGSNVIKR